jgi:hypothetical protein
VGGVGGSFKGRSRLHVLLLYCIDGHQRLNARKGGRRGRGRRAGFVVTDDIGFGFDDLYERRRGGSG